MNYLDRSKLISYLIFFIIPSYLIGIAITEILILSLILFFFFNNKDFYYFKDPKIIFLIFFSFLVSLSGLINLDYTDLQIASISHVRYVLLSITIFFLLDKLQITKDNLNINFLKFYFFIILFIIFDSFIQYFFGYNLFGQNLIRGRVSGIFGNDLILGSYLYYTLPISFLLILFFNFDINKNKKYLLIFFTLNLISIYISTSRTPFFLAIFFILLMIIFEKYFRKILLKCLALLLIFITFEAFFEFGKSKLFYRVFKMTFIQITDHYYHPKNTTEKNLKKKDDVVQLDTEKEKNILNKIVAFSDDHQNHYVLALKLFKDKPIIGNGPKGFRNYCRNVKYDPPIGICSTHPHNYFFQILSELGIIGMFFYLTGIVFIFLKLMKLFFANKINKSTSSFCVISLALLTLLFPVVPAGNFFNNWISIINYYYIGIYLYFYNQLHR